MKCPNCGALIYNTNSKFCEFCGTELPLKRETNDLRSNKISTSHSRRRNCCWFNT